MEPVTGLDLKIERIRAGVLGVTLAAAMGITSPRLSQIEKPEPVTERMAARYRSALGTCRTRDKVA